MKCFENVNLGQGTRLEFENTGKRKRNAGILVIFILRNSNYITNWQAKSSKKKIKTTKTPKAAVGRCT